MSLSRYQHVLQQRQILYNRHIQAGHATPFLYPWDTLPVLYLFLAIYWNRQLSRKNARRLNRIAFLLVMAHSFYIISHRRCLSMAGGYAIGLTLIFGTMSTWVLLVVNDPLTDFIRLEWRQSGYSGMQSVSISSSHEIAKDTQDIQKQKSLSLEHRLDETPGSNLKPMHQLVWQEMPEKPIHRIDWVFDLVTSFRGPNWNFRLPTMPRILVPEPSSKSAYLSMSLETSPLPMMEASYDSPAAHLFRRNTILKTTALYILIDIVKVAMISDAYFLGQAPLDSACDWAVIGLIHGHTGLPMPFLIRFSRLTLSLWGILNALILVFSYAPTFVYALLPKLINLRNLTFSPLQDIRFFTGHLSSPIPTIPNKGLSGLWGKCWHQMFRFVFSESSKPLLRMLRIPGRSQSGRAIQLLVAFGLSGFLHACGSYTSFSIIPSKPWMPMLFFLSQAVGIMLQSAIANLVQTLGLKPPRIMLQMTNCLFVLFWLYFTGPWLADDFARCGIWLFEPVPISFVRGFRGEGWWFWGGKYVEFWGIKNGHDLMFWHKGLAIV